MATPIIWGGKDASWQPTITRHSPAGAGQASTQATAGAAGGSDWAQEQIRVRCAKLAHLARPTEVSTCAAMALEKTYQLKKSVFFLAKAVEHSHRSCVRFTGRRNRLPLVEGARKADWYWLHTIAKVRNTWSSTWRLTELYHLAVTGTLLFEL